MISAILLAIRRECLLTWRRPVEWLNPLLFFFLVSILFPLTLSPDVKILQMMGPGIVWVAVLLAVLLSLTRLFQPDYEDGSLEQWSLGPYPLALLVFAKITAHWLMLFLPLLVMTPLMALMFHLPVNVVKILMITLSLGTPLLTLLGAIGAALIVSLRQSGLLLALILLPLYIPTLIFATAALNAEASGISPAASLLWLGALLPLALVLSPWASAITLRMGIAYR
jgi:heme exporter protein B